MTTCPICGDVLSPDARVCALCGTNLAAHVETELNFNLEDAGPGDTTQWEILEEVPGAAPAPPMALPLDPPAAIPLGPAAPAIADRPPAGTRCLVLYGADKRPVHFFPLRKDVLLIGRQDPVRGTFPDVNLDDWLDPASARKISRKHAVVLHTRADDSFHLRPLAGNTGTQIEQDMVEPLKDYPLRPGTRLILGGCARFKFEVMA